MIGERGGRTESIEIDCIFMVKENICHLNESERAYFRFHCVLKLIGIVGSPANATARRGTKDGINDIRMEANTASFASRCRVRSLVSANIGSAAS